MVFEKETVGHGSSPCRTPATVAPQAPRHSRPAADSVLLGGQAGDLLLHLLDPTSQLGQGLA